MEQIIYVSKLVIQKVHTDGPPNSSVRALEVQLSISFYRTSARYRFSRVSSGGAHRDQQGTNAVLAIAYHRAVCNVCLGGLLGPNILPKQLIYNT